MFTWEGGDKKKKGSNRFYIHMIIKTQVDTYSLLLSTPNSELQQFKTHAIKLYLTKNE